MSTRTSVHLSVRYPPVHLPIYLSLRPSVRLSTHLSICPSAHLLVRLPICPSPRPSVRLSVRRFAHMLIRLVSHDSREQQKHTCRLAIWEELRKCFKVKFLVCKKIMKMNKILGLVPSNSFFFLFSFTGD
jgi:hypothetical protein